MALLSFPVAPANNDLYPLVPAVGQNQYQWSSGDSTWKLVGVATGVGAGTYGDSTHVGQFTVNAAGQITFAQDVPIASGAGGTVTDVTAGTGLTGGTITTSGTISLDTAYTDARYVQESSLPLPISKGGTGQITRPAALNALLPGQTGQVGNYLSTDGTNAYWENTTFTLLTQASAPPVSSTSPGVQGQTASDLAYFYYHDGFSWFRTPWDTTPW